MDLPYLTEDFPGVGGAIKERPEDFAVTEIPLYEPSGQGEHVYCEIQKVNLTTFDAVNRIAAALKVHPKAIGFAGMKDAKAVTRQTLSIHGSTPEAVAGLKIDGVGVLWVDRHLNKIRLGHLKGNRFVVKIRGVNPTDVVKLQPVLQTIQKRGMPNYFGEQRFGRRGDNAALGAALIRMDNQDLLKTLLGRPNFELDDPQQIGARKAFDAGDLQRSLKLWPRHSGLERRILSRFMKTRKPGAAAKAIDERLRRLWVSALQSEMFNEVLGRRVQSGTMDRVLKGDFAVKHENNAGFLVEDEAAEQPRADSFEISPTGPLVGYRMTLPQGKPLAIEEEVFATHNMTREDFKREGHHRVKGSRRPLRVRPEDVELSGGVDEHGPFISVAFTLPAGSFATVLLRELMKSERHAQETVDLITEGTEEEEESEVAEQ
jgi:tRNA pseudouridine13 synthase